MSLVTDPNRPSIVKEGFLQKQGEKIKTWRLRYFFLLSNGDLLGFKVRPDHPFGTLPHNDFTVKGCQIFKMSKQFVFALRGLHVAKPVERMFSVNSEQDREEWLRAIGKLSESVSPPTTFTTVVMETENMSGKETDGSAIMVEPRESEIVSEVGMFGRKKVTFDSFEFLQLLGKGTFGKVILCRDKASRKLYAVKVISKEMVIKSNHVTHTLAENSVLQRIKHPFLLCSFQTEDHLCFVTEFLSGGDLYFHLMQEKVFSEDKARFYAAEIIAAVGYLHENGIVHRDLKLENLLLDKEGHLKLADFGLCKQYLTCYDVTDTFCGTREYMAPEVVQRIPYGFAVDWWAVGVIMYEMMVGRLPFYSKSPNEIFKLIESQEVFIPPKISSDGIHLLGSLLQKNPKNRLGSGRRDAKDIKEHPFFYSINWNDLLEKKITPPFQPQVEHDTDTRYFDGNLALSPIHFTPPTEVYSKSRDVDFFDGFSCKSLSSTLGSSCRSLEIASMN